MERITMVILTICACIACTTVKSQYKISGQVLGIEKKPIEAATIILQNVGDSTIVKTGITDKFGNFILQGIKPGKYQLQVTMVGYESLKTASINIDSLSPEKAVLKSIQLIPLSTALNEVVVTGKKPLIEHKIDRTIVNVEAMISSTGGNALEVLEKSPGVIVDQNGNISLIGKSGVVIMIDDKPTYLSGENLAGYLKSLPASLLEQIELMPNPPAKYEAAGNAGIINIKTKKIKTKGFNGTVTTSLGKTRLWRMSEGLNLNYRTLKFNLFVNVGYGIQNSNRRLDLQRNYFNAAGNLTTVYNSLAFFKPVTRSSNFKLGADYYVSSKTTVGFLFTEVFSHSHTANPVNSSLYGSMGLLDSSIIADNKTISKLSNRGINLNYSHKFDSLGKTLNVDLDYINYASRTNQSFLNSIFYPNGNLKNTQLITDNLPADINIYSAKTDYSQPMKGKMKLDAGFKTSYVNTDNAARYFNVINNISTVDERNSNRFLYKENINAAYISFNKELNRLSLQAGLRFENTNIKAHQFGNTIIPDSAFTQQYSNLFPTAYISYKLDSAGHHQLNFSFGKRIDRPYYKDLNPFINIIDKFTYFSGNSFLKSQLSSNYELTYHFKSLFSFSVLYNNTSNYQSETVRQTGDIFISSTQNIGQRIYKAVNANLSLHPAKWWDCNIYSEVVNLNFKSSLSDINFNSKKTYLYIESGIQFNLSNNWSAELSGFYISSRIVSQFNLDPKGAINMGVQKRFMKRKASVKLTASDILLTNFSSGNISNVKGATSNYHNDFDTRMLTLGFSYNFGSSSKNSTRRNTGSSQSEQNRVRF